jgi:ankyrin repeat protein
MRDMKEEPWTSWHLKKAVIQTQETNIGYTLLHVAAEAGHVEVVELLLKT